MIRKADPNGRGWYRDSMPLIVALVGGVFALASKIESCGAKREVVVASALADAALETSDSLRIEATEREGDLVTLTKRVTALEVAMLKIKSPAARRLVAEQIKATRAKIEPRKWWKPWTWG